MRGLKQAPACAQQPAHCVGLSGPCHSGFCSSFVNHFTKATWLAAPAMLYEQDQATWHKTHISGTQGEGLAQEIMGRGTAMPAGHRDVGRAWGEGEGT